MGVGRAGSGRVGPGELMLDQLETVSVVYRMPMFHILIEIINLWDFTDVN